ncbi:hypothetical protein E05_42110 [Plautia stali symbiont]|nr:hypothetical protein E05_42110 [Plautia stali symbiont]
MEFTQMKTMTLAELAKRVGVGVATVDRVLNDRGGVSPAMTKKILLAAREAGLKRILPEEHRHAWQIEAVTVPSSFNSWRRILPGWRMSSAIVACGCTAR